MIEGEQRQFDPSANEDMTYVKYYLTSLITANHEGYYLNFPYKKLQKRISESLYESVTKSLERLPVDNRLSATSKTNQYYSGKWLILPPVPSSYFDNSVFRMAIAIKLNLDLVQPGLTCPHCSRPSIPKAITSSHVQAQVSKMSQHGQRYRGWILRKHELLCRNKLHPHPLILCNWATHSGSATRSAASTIHV